MTHTRGIPSEQVARLYWAMRVAMVFLWTWTAFVSWFMYPHDESLAWLRALGLTWQTGHIFAGLCLFDLAMGFASAALASRRLWQLQFVAVTAYSLAIGLMLPAFLLHPFGPISKNAAVLACLAFLWAAEGKTRSRT